MSDTVAERILVEWAARLEEATEPEFSAQWVTVSRSPLSQQEKLLGDAVAIYQVSERLAYETGRTVCTLRVGVEFWYKTKKGDVPSTELNRQAGDLKRLFMVDPNTVERVTDAQLTMQVRVLSVDFDVDGPNDSFVSGYMELDMTYRHAPGDPTQLM